MSSHGGKRPLPSHVFRPNKRVQSRRNARDILAQTADDALHEGELDLQKFLEAREFEIRALEQSMRQSKASRSSRAFQRVPRALRRRTASHNVKRVPKRLRRRAVREMKTDNTPTVTARRRRPKTTRARIRREGAKQARKAAQRRKRTTTTTTTTTTTSHGDKQDGDDTDMAEDTKITTGQAKSTAKPSRPCPPKLRRNLPNPPLAPRRSKFRKRQRTKTWLPTHVWHAKRARMTPPTAPLWGFAIPLTPNEKCYRPTHRAHLQKGAIMWDTSYTSTIAVCGSISGLRSVLGEMGVPSVYLCAATEPGSDDPGRLWRQGLRAWTGMLSSRVDVVGEKVALVPRRSICPATVFWDMTDDTRQSTTSTDAKSSTQTTTTTTTPSTQAKPKNSERRVLIRCHPAAFSDVFIGLVEWAQRQKPQAYVEDLRYQVASLDITGPAATEALLSALVPCSTPPTARPPGRRGDEHAASSSAHASLFTSLFGLTNVAAVPTNALLHFPIQDPRLTYPPKRAVYPTAPALQQALHQQLIQTLATWSVDTTGRTEMTDNHTTGNHTGASLSSASSPSLWNRYDRFKASLLPSKKSIDRRRGALLPGASLTRTAVDPAIPITLLATHTAGSQNNNNNHHPHADHPFATWTLLVPWACLQPIWYALAHVPLSTGGNPRFGGLAETRQVALERGQPWFPGDFLATEAGRRWEAEQAAHRRQQWEKRPRGKRVHWQAVRLGLGRRGEVGNGFGCDFDAVFGRTDEAFLQDLHISSKETGNSTGRASASELSSQDPKRTFQNTAMDLDEVPSTGSSSSLAPNASSSLSSNLSSSNLVRIPGIALTHFLSHYQKHPIQKHNPSSSSSPPPLSIPPRSIFQVRLRVLGRGLLQPCARIYRLPNPSEDQPVGRLTAPSSSASNQAGGVVTSAALYQLWRSQFATLSKSPSSSSSSSVSSSTSSTVSLRDCARNDLTNAGSDPQHLPVPDAVDLMGFVTSTAFSLTRGCATAIGSVGVERAVEALVREAAAVQTSRRRDPGRPADRKSTKTAADKAGTPSGMADPLKLCIVRNSGESVGFLAAWEAI